MAMFPINKFQIEAVSETDNQGVYKVGPLPKGYGATLGNLYRRLLLSSIPGAAVTKVKVDGIQHEYTTLAGLDDTVLKFILGLKGLAIISHSDEPVILQLNVKGNKDQPLEIKASDIEKNPMIEIINDDYVIATLTDEKTKVNAEITIEKGIGYALPDDSVRKEVGTIPVDAVFTPVLRVAMEIKHTRVGQQTDLDQLQLTVDTDGSINPSAAVYKASEILTKVSEHLLESAETMLNAETTKQVENAELPLADHALEEKLEKEPLFVADFNLSTRLTNALLNSNYEDLNQLEGLTEEEVSSIKGMGEKSFTELKDILKENGINLI